jgi:hypothetical protein
VSAEVILLGVLAYLAVGVVFALVVYLVDRGDGREFARTLDRWWTPLLYLCLVLLVVLGIGVLFGGIG